MMPQRPNGWPPIINTRSYMHITTFVYRKEHTGKVAPWPPSATLQSNMQQTAYLHQQWELQYI